MIFETKHTYPRVSRKSFIAFIDRYIGYYAADKQHFFLDVLKETTKDFLKNLVQDKLELIQREFGDCPLERLEDIPVSSSDRLPYEAKSFYRSLSFYFGLFP